jgi:hypothetical protein
MNAVRGAPLREHPMSPRRTPPEDAAFRFALASPADNAELLQFSRAAEMPGALRVVLDRTPDYFDALRVEGRLNEALVCRDAGSGRLIAVGHRSIKPMYVDGVVAPVGYLGGLRVAADARNARLLTQGYAHLRALQADRPARFHLTTIMEDNAPARNVLLSHRLGLPAYRDFGRFCCVATNLHGGEPSRAQPELTLRRATAADAAAIVGFLRREGSSRQFFPEYTEQDFGQPGGLLQHLGWEDVFLACCKAELIGMLAAWDQRSFRRWRIAGYAPWLRVLRIPLNLAGRFRRTPALPRPGRPLDCCVLSLICIKGDNRDVFRSLLGEVMRTGRDRCAFYLAGLHERDPLLPELLARPHVPLYSRLYVVAWEGEADAVRALDRTRVPYLETGSL